MKYLHLLSLFFVLVATPAYAQSDISKTPREQILHDLALAGNAVDGTINKAAVKTETIIELRGSSLKKASETASEAVTEKTSEKTSLDALLDVITAEIVIPERPKEAKKPPKIIAPFYLSAQDYLDLRGAETSAQLVLHYEVASGGASGTGLGTKKDVKLIIGVDYAAMQVDKNLTIYDFKLDRVLRVKPEYNMDGKTTGNLLFENTSLYAKVYRDITAVRRATNNGRIKKLDMGQGTTLDTFWVESSMSWAENKSEADIIIKKSGASLKIKLDDDVVFSAEFTDEEYGDASTKNSLFAFAHHEWPLHPSVLRTIYAYDAPPQWFEMLSYGPSALKGQRQVWTLVKRENVDAKFPLLPEATGAAQAQQVSPLVFLINEAVNNRALGGIQSVDALKQDFQDKMDMEAFGSAWIIGQKYMAYSGGCQNPHDLTICSAVIKLEQTQKLALPKRIQDYMTAIASARSKGKKAETVAIITPYMDEQETPAFIIRTAAMARAKMKKAKAKEAGIASLNAETLLQTALAKDPYDPNTYVGLAQVLAARGAFEQSWDIYDALRAGIPTADSLDLKITSLESRLRRTAPGYFLE